MAKVGDAVKLPSGRTVRVKCAGIPDRPWAAIEVNHLWQVCREHQHPGRPGVSHYFDGKRPLQLDEADARALAAALNLAR